jgi:hypothetical protein
MAGDHAIRGVNGPLKRHSSDCAVAPTPGGSVASTSTVTVDRRALIFSLIAVLGSELRDRVPFEKRITQLGRTHNAFRFREPEAAAWLGRTYLAMVPSDRDPIALEKAVYGKPLPASRTAMEKRLAENIERDFLIGNMVAVGGWCLARTEARLCALSALG